MSRTLGEGDMKAFREMRVLVLSLAGVAGVVWSLPGLGAQESKESAQQRRGVLEEVVVTARKQEESLQDVSISVSVMSGEYIDDNGLTRLANVSELIPGVTVAPSPVGDGLFIRGIGSGENQGFEMSVGTFVDGVYYGRGRSSRQPFLDAERVEVLRGPQPTLFGKNIVGGAFNITSRKPTDEKEAALDVYWEPEYNTYQTTGILSGPVSDELAMRVVARVATTDGYISNSLNGNDETARDDWMLRGTAVWTPSSALSITFKAEYANNELDGGRAQLSQAAPALAGLSSAVDPRAEFDLDFNKSGPGTLAPFNKEFDDSTASAGVMTIEWNLSDQSTLTSISSFSGYEVDYSFDVDFAPISFIHQMWDQEYDTWAQEIRLSSREGETISYMAGIYLSNEDLSNDKDLPVNFAAVPPLAGLPSGLRLQHFDQETSTQSAFGQLTWSATDDLSLVFGLRYTRDKKEAKKDLFWTTIGSTTPVDALGGLFSSIGLGTPHNYQDLSRTTTNWSGNLTAEYRVGDIMFYGSYTEGFKSGGFDESNTTGLIPDIIFDDENVKSVELGFKSRLLDDQMQLNVAVFRSEYDNLQVSTLGVASLVVGNAAASTTQGIDVDAQWALSERLLLSMSYQGLDASYDDYPTGACYFGQPGPFCDLSGEDLQYAPNSAGTIKLQWDDQLTSSWRYKIDVDTVYTSDFYTAGDLDPFLKMDSYTKWNARVAVYSEDEKWNSPLSAKTCLIR
jgi:iron complex outermembrane recepter protein